MSKLRYLLLALPLAGGVYLWSGSRTNDAAAAAQRAIAGRPAVLVAPGRVEPVRDPVKLAFEAQGRIAELLADEGDAVQQGQVLARLDDRLAKARVAAAEAQLAQARARHLQARRGPRREDVTAARAEADAAAAAAAHRGAEQARSARLGQAGAVADAVVDADDAAARVAAAQAQAAAARYESLAKGTRAEQIDDAAAAVMLRQAELDAARVALDQTVLRAPRGGVILRRTAEVGALVTLTQPQPIFTLADLSQIEVRAEVDEADVAAIRVDTPAYATADAFGEQRFPIRVARVTRELGRKTARDDDPRARVDTRVLEVIARFEDVPGAAPGAALPIGLRVNVHIGR
jgi:HlyD family secretion protein